MPRIDQIRRTLFNDEDVGMGFNSDTGDAVGTALENFTVQDNPVAPGQRVRASLTIINTHDELMESLGMSFAAQGRYGFFKASAKADFAESTNYNSTSTFVVAKCVVYNPFRRGQNFRVKDEARALLQSNRFDEFKTAFGDSFVRGLQTGGEFYAVIRITSTSLTTQSKLTAELQAEANGLVAGGSFKAAFETANSRVETRSEYVATMYQNAGRGPQISPTVEIAEVINRYKSFPEIAAASAAAYETELATYDTLPLPVPTAEEQEDFLFALADAREQKLRFIQLRNDLIFASRNPLFFEDLPDSPTLASAAATYTKLLNAVTDHAIRLSRGELDPPRVFDPTALTPPLQEPASIQLRRKPDAPPIPPPPSIRVPNFTNEWSDQLVTDCLDLFARGYSVDDLVNGQPEAEQGQPPYYRPRNIVEFLASGVRVKIDYLPGADPRGGNWVRAQVPQANSLVAPGQEVVLQVGP